MERHRHALATRGLSVRGTEAALSLSLVVRFLFDHYHWGLWKWYAGQGSEGKARVMWFCFLDMMTKVSKWAGSAWWLSERAKQLIVNREEWWWGTLQTARCVFRRQHCSPASCFSAVLGNGARRVPGHRNNENTGTSCTSVQSGPTSAHKTCTLASELSCLMTWTDWKTCQTSPSD